MSAAAEVKSKDKFTSVDGKVFEVKSVKDGVATLDEVGKVPGLAPVPSPEEGLTVRVFDLVGKEQTNWTPGDGREGSDHTQAQQMGDPALGDSKEALAKNQKASSTNAPSPQAGVEGTPTGAPKGGPIGSNPDAPDKGKSGSTPVKKDADKK